MEEWYNETSCRCNQNVRCYRFWSFLESVGKKLKACENAVVYMECYEQFDGLNTKLAAPIANFELPKHYSRKQTRGMGRVAKMATVASAKWVVG